MECARRSRFAGRLIIRSKAVSRCICPAPYTHLSVSIAAAGTGRLFCSGGPVRHGLGDGGRPACRGWRHLAAGSNARVSTGPTNNSTFPGRGAFFRRAGRPPLRQAGCAPLPQDAYKVQGPPALSPTIVQPIPPPPRPPPPDPIASSPWGWPYLWFRHQENQASSVGAASSMISAFCFRLPPFKSSNFKSPISQRGLHRPLRYLVFQSRHSPVLFPLSALALF